MRLRCSSIIDKTQCCAILAQQVKRKRHVTGRDATWNQHSVRNMRLPFQQGNPDTPSTQECAWGRTQQRSSHQGSLAPRAPQWCRCPRAVRAGGFRSTINPRSRASRPSGTTHSSSSPAVEHCDTTSESSLSTRQSSGAACGAPAATVVAARAVRAPAFAIGRRVLALTHRRQPRVCGLLQHGRPAH